MVIEHTPLSFRARVNMLKHISPTTLPRQRIITLGLSAHLLDSGFHVFGGCRHMFGVDEEHL